MGSGTYVDFLFKKDDLRVGCFLYGETTDFPDNVCSVYKLNDVDVSWNRSTGTH